MDSLRNHWLDWHQISHHGEIPKEVAVRYLPTIRRGAVGPGFLHRHKAADPAAVARSDIACNATPSRHESVRDWHPSR